jgi:VWFA-related protein
MDSMKFGCGRLRVVASMVVLSLGAQMSAQEPAQLTVIARLVVLDVTVVDSAGRPVNDLTDKDFQVYEDGVQQRIRSVEAPSQHVLPAASLKAGAAEVFDPAKPESFGLSPVTVLLLDEANTHFADSSYARKQLQSYLAKQPAVLPQPTNLLSVYDLHFKQLQGFTRDRDALLKALASAPTEYAWKLEVNGSVEDGPIERLDQSLRVLEQIAESYARIRGRKNLVWVGGGFPTLDPTMFDGDEDLAIKHALRHVTDTLLDTRVTLYAVDPSSTAASNTEITSPEQLMFAEMAGDAMTVGSDPFSTTNEFDRLGVVTGGRVVRGRNDVSAQIAQAVEQGDDFYTLAYSPSAETTAAAAYRKIEVRVLRPGLKVLTRNGYYPNPDRPESAPETAAYDLSIAAESTVPLNGLRVKATPDAKAGMWDVEVGAADLVWKSAADGAATASVYILAAEMNGKGKMSSHTTAAMKATAKAGTDLHDASRMATFVVAAPGKSKGDALRFVVRDSATGKMGSVDVGKAGNR